MTPILPDGALALEALYLGQGDPVTLATGAQRQDRESTAADDTLHRLGRDVPALGNSGKRQEHQRIPIPSSARHCAAYRLRAVRRERSLGERKVTVVFY